MSDIQIIPQSDEYREGWQRIWGKPHLETTAGADMEAWSHLDSASMPVNGLKIGIPGREDV